MFSDFNILTADQVVHANEVVPDVPSYTQPETPQVKVIRSQSSHKASDKSRARERNTTSNRLTGTGRDIKAEEASDVWLSNRAHLAMQQTWERKL